MSAKTRKSTTRLFDLTPLENINGKILSSKSNSKDVSVRKKI